MGKTYEIKEIIDKHIWEKFVLSSHPRSFLQSWNWGETHRRLGKRIFRLGYYSRGSLYGVCLMIQHDAKRGKHFTISGGPLIDWNDRELVNTFLDSIKNISREIGAWFVRVRPEIVDTADNILMFHKLGFIESSMHLDAESTWIVDLKGSDEQILANMRKTTRYLIKKGLKENFKIIKTKDTHKINTLFQLQKQTVERHKFVGFSEQLFHSELECFSDDDQGELFILEHNSIPLVAALVLYYGDYAYYHFSGSSEDARNTPASYLMQWEIIKEARIRGKEYYNMWGISKTDNPKHRFYGVSVFKKGFGGERIDWLHAKDLPLKKAYYLTHGFEMVRKYIRHLN